MATINRELRKRPIKLIKDDDINPKNMERLLTHYDERLQQLDMRRIAQQSTVSEGADTSETVSNLVTAVNALLVALNNSSLTED